MYAPSIPGRGGESMARRCVLLLLVLATAFVAGKKEEEIPLGDIMDVHLDVYGDVSEDVGYRVTFLRALDKRAKRIDPPEGKRIAVGWNTNVDLVVNGVEVVKDFPAPLDANRGDVTAIKTMPDFFNAFAYWFEKGAAAERFVSSPELFQKIVELASTKSSRSQFKTGGNAALMATALADLSCKCDVLLGGAVGPELRLLLSSNIRTVAEEVKAGAGRQRKHASHPSMKDNEETADAVHLILEYQKGESWGGLTSPRANRFIVVHDEYNSHMRGLESMGPVVRHESEQDGPFKAFIASGLNQLEPLQAGIREVRLQAVWGQLKAINTKTPIHLELASMADRSFLRRMFDTLVVYGNSLGLNEEELAMLYEVLGGTYVETAAKATARTFTKDMLTGKVPDPRAVGLAIDYVLAHADTLPPWANRRITRVHFHCLAFHIIAIRLNAKTSYWTPMIDSAVAQGAVAAVLKACGHELLEFEESHIELIAPMSFTVPDGTMVMVDADEPVGVWVDGAIRYFYAPVPVCNAPKNTVGLGDAISANGLAYSLAP